MSLIDQLKTLGFEEGTHEKADPGQALVFYGELTQTGKPKIMAKFQNTCLPGGDTFTLELGVLLIPSLPDAMRTRGVLNLASATHRLSFAHDDAIPDLEPLIVSLYQMAASLNALLPHAEGED